MKAHVLGVCILLARAGWTLDCPPQSNLSCSTRTTDFLQCSCRPDCFQFGDCCLDNSTDGQQPPGTEVLYRCVTLETFTVRYLSLYLVSRCPSSWQNAVVRNYCQESKLFGYFFSIPVSNNVTIYRNIYCAICNEDPDVTFWHFNLNCLSYVSTENASSVFEICKPLIVVPSLWQTRVPNCIKNMIQACPESHANLDIGTRCTTYLSPVEISSECITYKNIFCARCHEARMEDLTCPKEESFEPKEKASPNAFSYSFLLDVDLSQNSPFVGESSRCGQGEAYDPWDEVCRQIDFELFTDSAECIGRVETNFRFVDNETIILENGKKVGTVDFEEINSTAVRLCFLENMFEDRFGVEQGILTVVCLTVSITFFGIKFCLECLHPDRWTFPKLLIQNISLSTCGGQVFFLVAYISGLDHVGCFMVAVMMHFLFLSSNFWTSALSFNIWTTFNKTNTTIAKKYSFYKYALYGFGMPALIVSVSLAVEWYAPGTAWRADYGLRSCWLSNRKGLLIFFAVPTFALSLLNLYFFATTTFNLVVTSNSCKLARENIKKADKVRFAMYLKLALIMGLTWTFGFVATLLNSQFFWYLFVFFNSSQGVFICIAFSNLTDLLCSQTNFRKSLSWKSISSQGKSTATSNV